MMLVRDDGLALTGGIVVEAEAYNGPEDRASHARAGRTRRTEPLFGPAGHAYVYLVYGMHHCLNVVSDTVDKPGAVLLRALAPTFGLDSIRTRRGRPHEPDVRLGAGPARLCQALDVDLRLDRLDLTRRGPLFLASPSAKELASIRANGIVTGTRVGVEYADEWGEKPWRFGLRGHPSLSRPFRGERCSTVSDRAATQARSRAAR
jgi:DNA-3-methyladenine glycosylase